MFSFRFKFKLDSGLQLVSDKNVLVLEEAPPVLVRLRPEFPEVALKDARSVVVRGDGYSGEDAAWSGYSLWSASVKLGLAKHGVGADFGTQPYGQSGMTSTALEAMEEHTGQRFVADDHVPMVFRSDPTPLFVSAGAVQAIKGVNADRVVKSIREDATMLAAPMSRRLHFALDLYGRAQGLEMPEAKLVMLVTAVEAVLDRGKRDPEVVKTVKALNQVINISQLSEKMRLKLGSQVGDHKNKSITESGRELMDANQVWSPDGESSGDFWERCYELRSKIVHGDETAAEGGEIGIRAAQAEIVVGALLRTLALHGQGI